MTGRAFSYAIVAAFALLIVSEANMMPGGQTKQDPNSPEYMDKAWKAAKGVNEKNPSNSNALLVPVKVISAQTQVVAGIKYTFEVVFAESTCQKNQVDLAELSAANCPLKDGGKREIYEVELWEKPWENFQQFEVKKVRDVAADETF